MSAPRPRVALRADGGPALGGGHLARARALALALATHGADTALLRSGAPPEPQGFGSIGILGVPLPDGDDPEAEAPAATQRADAASTVSALGDGGSIAVVVDHYGLGAAWEQEVRRLRPDLRIVAIDDLPGRTHEADLLVDPNLGPLGSGPSAHPEARILRGPAYALLGPEHRVTQVDPTPDPADPPRVLVALGAGRIAALPEIARGLAADSRLATVGLDLIVPHDEQRVQLTRLLADRPGARVSGRVPSLAPMLRSCTLAVGAGGTTAWERLRAGVASVVVDLAPNQIRNCRALDELGLARWVDRDAGPDALADAVVAALSDLTLQRRCRVAGPMLVDGRGQDRVALALLPPTAPPVLRRARIEDAGALLAMANDPVTRLASRRTDAIDPERHVAWLTGLLADPDALVLVAEVGDLPVGQVRFQRLGGGWELSYGLEAAVRGRGLAEGLVRSGLRLLRAERTGSVVAVVGAANRASRTTFERLGFDPDPDGLIARDLGAEVGPGFTAYLLPESHPTP